MASIVEASSLIYETPSQQLVNSTALPDASVLYRNSRRSFVATAAPRKPRAVNAWLAFRAYYNRIFSHEPQKEASKYLKQMWDLDPFKPKWAVLAYAYTQIRDFVGKDNASLSTYLTSICPRMGILSLDNYFENMKLEFRLTESGIALYQVAPPEFEKFPINVISNGMTQKDIYLLCGQLAYIPQITAESLANFNNQHGLLTSIPNHQIGSSQMIHNTTNSPETVASSVLGFDVAALLESTDPGFPYTQTIDYLNGPEDGFINVNQLVSGGYGSDWDPINLEDPQALEGLFNDVPDMLRTGYLAPGVEGISNWPNV